MQTFTRFWKGIGLWVLELSLPTRARSVFYIPVAWFGLLLIFFSDGAMIILAINLRIPPPKGSCLDTFPQALWSLHCLQETGQKIYSVLTWLVGKVLFVGIFIHHFSLQNLSSQKGKAVFFLPQLCVSCRDSLRLRMPCLVRVPKYSTDTCSSGPAMTFMCAFRDARRYWLQWTKFQISKREY